MSSYGEQDNGSITPLSFRAEPPPRDAEEAHEAELTKKWMATGISLNDATAWRKAWGDDTGPYDVWQWRAAGFGPSESNAWAKSGYSVIDALQWKLVGCGPEHAQLFPDVVAVRRWIDRGFTVKEAVRWVDEAGISDIEIVRTWLDIGCGPNRTAKWLVVDGVMSPQDAKPWMEIGCSPKDAKRWLEVQGIESAADAKVWRESSMTGKDALAWSRILPGGLEEARSWIAIGCDPEEAEAWRELDPSMFVAEIYSWKQADMTPESLRIWRKALQNHDLAWNRMTPEFVRAWTFANCTPRQAARCLVVGLTPTDVMRLQEQGYGPKEAAEVVGYRRPVPEKGRNRPTWRRRSLVVEPTCANGKHEDCKQRDTCGCGCHCWHDEIRFDFRLQAPYVGTNVSRSWGRKRTSHKCRSDDPTLHAKCHDNKQCKCSCHCWHRAI